SGWNRVTKVMMVAIVALFVLSGFFRGFDMKMIESFHLTSSSSVSRAAAA
ncbi:DUF4311 domain-containing protein, partial [Klebsiella pneumoniae]